MKEWMNSHCLPVMISREKQCFPVSIAISNVPAPVLAATSHHFLHRDEYTTLTGAAQHHYLLGRHAAKLAATGYMQANPTTIRITPGVFGQPVLYSPVNSNVQVSIAHSGKSAMAIVFPEWHPMAVDVEWIDTNKILPVLPPAEWSLLASCQYSDAEKFCLLWTAKEALSKVLKTGLTTTWEILRIQQLQLQDNCIIFTFTHFLQYKAIGWIAGKLACSIVMPERSQIDTMALQALHVITSPG